VIALLNGGAVGEGRNLESATVESIGAHAFHAASSLARLDVWFREMRRNGRRALSTTARRQECNPVLCWFPRRSSAISSWSAAALARILAHAGRYVFDRIFAPQSDPDLAQPTPARPARSRRAKATGDYQPGSDPSANIALLKIAGRRLNVLSADDGTLVDVGCDECRADSEGGRLFGAARAAISMLCCAMAGCSSVRGL